jgi:hypothetical protein
MKTSELIDLIDSLYPNATTLESKILFMNMALEKLSPYFGIIAEDATLTTVANQDYYDFPEGISDVSEIISLAIGNSATPTNRYDYMKYSLSKREDYPEQEEGYYQIVNSTGAKKLVLYPVPLYTGYPIVLRYHKGLTKLNASNMEFEPEFDSKYHSMLAFWCCHMICTVGSSPDSYQANMFMAKYDSSLTDLWKLDMEQKEVAKQTRSDNRQWHGRKSYSRGY